MAGRVLRRGSKYGAVAVNVEGIRFASKAEARRYQELRLLEKAGELRNLILQPKYRLFIQSLVSRRMVKCGEYRGDFQYETKLGQAVLEDVKGVRTPVYKLKKRIVEALYGITITEV